jgi:putative transcriptional regulator
MRNCLRVLRAERRWSQADLAGELGVSRQTVNALETEKYDPSLPLAYKIGRLFARPIEEIFFDGEDAGSSAQPAIPVSAGGLSRSDLQTPGTVESSVGESPVRP